MEDDKSIELRNKNAKAKLAEEQRKWKNERAKIRRKERMQREPDCEREKGKERERKRRRLLSVSKASEELDQMRKRRKRARNGAYEVRDDGYWDCGEMKFKCKLCSALHYLGERKVTAGSTLKDPKFSLCCANGQLTPHFELSSGCPHCKQPFRTKDNVPRPPLPGEACKNCSQVVPLVLPAFPEPPTLLRELLTAQTAEAKHFRGKIRGYNSALAMGSVCAQFVSRGPGPSKFFPTITVHGRMHHEIGALIPPAGKKPRFAAVYIHDTEHAAANRKHFYSDLREDLLSRLAQMLQSCNNLVKTFVSLRDLIESGSIPEEAQLVIHAHERNLPGHARKYNLPESSEVAALIVGEQYGKLDILLRKRGQLNRNGHEELDTIRIGNRMYDPLCYPLLLPYGKHGWHSKLLHMDSKGKPKKVTPLKYYTRLLFERDCDFNTIIHSGRLFQQYLCEMFVKVECERLSYLRENQSKLRSCDYTHLCELLADAAMERNEVQAWTKSDGKKSIGDIGKLVVLPSTHIGGERYMRQKMHDIIAISNSLGHPDVFLTMTCNPKWPEIESALLPSEKSTDRPDVCNRVFRMKWKLLMSYLKESKPFGDVVADVSVIEFQKRGLVHAHIILFLSTESKQKLQDPLRVDEIISAEIPSESDSELRQAVLKHMIHLPCNQGASSLCLREGRCSRGFPKPFRVETGSCEGDYYISYKRRREEDSGETAKFSSFVPGLGKRELKVDNSWVVPYSPALLRMFRCHLNVELCISKVGSIKYLFKYVCKGPDRVTVEVSTTKSNVDGRDEPEEQLVIDEIKSYQDARYVSASEASWRLFSFPIVEHNPTVERLEVHLEGRHTVYFEQGLEKTAAERGSEKATKLMAWFAANEQYANAKHIRYIDYPKYFVWNVKNRQWSPRSKFRVKGSKPVMYDFARAPDKVVGRMYNVSPREGERYFLRTLLIHKAGATCFDDMKTVDGKMHSTYREACCAMGLLSDDLEWRRCIFDAFASTFEPLTKVFATILAFCEPSSPQTLWNENAAKFVDDIRRRHSNVPEAKKILQDDEHALNYALRELNSALIDISPRLNIESFGFAKLSDELRDLPAPKVDDGNSAEGLRVTVEHAINEFNEEQRVVFDAIVGEVLPGVNADDPLAPVDESKLSNVVKSRGYFLDSPGGTGKTFTIRTIHALLRLRERNVIAVATSAVAASLLDGGRTAHSVFKIPIPCYAESVCSISLDSALAARIREADLIIWDEIVMCVRYSVEAVDRTLRAIMDAEDIPFGGKCVLFSGDFRQILPVVPKGSRGMIVHMCLKSSPLFSDLTVLRLSENMRLKKLKEDPDADEAALQYPEYLLRVGEGRLEQGEEGNVDLPKSVNIIESRDELIKEVFGGLEKGYANGTWLTSRVILATTNANLRSLNDAVGDRFPGKYRTYRSADSANSDNPELQKAMELTYPQELLNSVETGSSLPEHLLRIKKGFIVMLLRNIRPRDGHVNGTRYVVENMSANLLFLRAVSGTHRGNALALPRMNCSPGVEDFPIPGFRRCQYPVRVCFAMTINKAQGQSVSGKLGIDLSSGCFSHGQLYVALSRTTHPKNVYMCTSEGNGKTKNVVYSEVMQESVKSITEHAAAAGSLPIEKNEKLTTNELKSTAAARAQSPDMRNVPARRSESALQSRSLARLYRCGRLQISDNDIATVRNEVYVVDNALHAFLELLNSTEVMYLMSYFWSFIDTNELQSALPQYFGRNLGVVVENLECCRLLLLPQFSEDKQHWGLCVFDKTQATIRVYDSLPDLGAFSGRLSTLKSWAETVKTAHRLENWPVTWSIDSSDRLSPIQDNGHACGIHTMLNAYYYSRGHVRPSYPVRQVPDFRRRLARCLETNSLEPLSE